MKQLAGTFVVVALLLACACGGDSTPRPGAETVDDGELPVGDSSSRADGPTRGGSGGDGAPDGELGSEPSSGEPSGGSPDGGEPPGQEPSGGDVSDPGVVVHSNCPDAANQAPVDGLEHLGGGTSSGGLGPEIVDVVADGEVAYVCTGTRGLMIQDVSGSSPQTLASGVAPSSETGFATRCQHIDVVDSGQRILITNRGDQIQRTPWLSLFDVSSPGSPRELATWSGSESIEGVVSDGDRIYAAAHDSGVLVFEHDGGSGLELVGRYDDEQSNAWQPVLHKGVLIVAETAAGVRFYDVSGASPELLTTVEVGGAARDVIVVDDVAYIAASSSVAAIDVGDPTQPALLGQTPSLGTALAVAMGQNDTLMTAEWDAVRGYDISDPGNPRLVLQERLPSSADFSRVFALDAVPDPQGTTGRLYAGEWNALHSYAQADCSYGPDVWVSPTSLQFPVVSAGDQATKVVAVTNAGNQALQVSEIESSSAQLEVVPDTLEIEPGDSKAIEVTFAPSSTQQLSAEVTLVSNDLDEGRFDFLVTGNVPGLDVGDPAPDFELSSLEGETWSLSALRGNVVVLAYFATF